MRNIASVLSAGSSWPLERDDAVWRIPPRSASPSKSYSGVWSPEHFCSSFGPSSAEASAGRFCFFSLRYIFDFCRGPWGRHVFRQVSGVEDGAWNGWGGISFLLWNFEDSGG